MKHLRKLLAVLLCLATLLSMAGCQKPAVETTDTASSPSDESTIPGDSTIIPSESLISTAYDKAAAAVDAAAALELTVTFTETRKVSGEIYERVTGQTIALAGQGTDAMTVYVEETVTQGDTVVESTEYYDGTTVYTSYADGSLFRSDMAAEDYLSRLVPAVILDSSLYGNVMSSNEMDFVFSEPLSGESWAVPETATLIQACGTATLSPAGLLTAATYTATYAYAAAEITLDAQVQISVKDSLDLSAHAPADPEAHTELEYIDAPKVLELAVQDIYDTNTMTFTASKDIYSDAAELQISTTDTSNLYGSGESLLIQSDYSVESWSFYEDAGSHTKSLSYENGVCTTIEDNGKPRTETISPEKIAHSCKESITELLTYSTGIKKAEITDLGNLYLLEFKGSDSFGTTLYADICDNFLPDKSTYVDDTVTTFKTKTLAGYLSIDQFSGLPVAFSYHFEWLQTIDGSKYELSGEASVTLHIGHTDAYENITGEPLPDEKPEVAPTPLFYRVTGSNGEEMWLLGTIHLGDNRTAYLPQEIYNAFNASDALAVEFDLIAFEEQLETDKKLQTQLSLASAYINGTTLEDHVDKDVYKSAIAMLKATGSYFDGVEYLKAGLVESYVSDYVYRHVPELTSKKGVDHRLLQLAKEQNKTILDVESGLFQFKMFTGCSEELQEVMLADAIATDAVEYRAEIIEMFEAWCSGDEAVLKEYIATDLSDVSEEELVLYEEYTKIMETDRNVGMLNKAIEYLESGDTIFYAVGLAHLLAEDGLVNTLRDAGFTVELVTYAE